jgi:alpha-methylacyl-CoA racemase
MKIKFQKIFLEKTQLEWTCLFDGSDACVTPVLSFTDPIPNSTPTDNQEQWPRKAAMPQPAPLLSRTPAIKAEILEDPFMEPGKHTIEILNEFGIESNEIQHLLKSDAIIDSSLSSHL